MLPLKDAYEAAPAEGVWLERPSALRLARLTGPQRVWFLQNTITADVSEAPAGRWVESCFLDPKGRIQAHFRVGFGSEDVWLDVEPDASALAEWFERYRFRTKVEIETVRRTCYAVLGPAAKRWARPGDFVAGDGDVAFGLALGDLPVAVVHSDDRPSGLPDDQAPAELYDLFRIEAGVGAYGRDFGERNLPQEAGLTRVLSVDKGCYVGQETVARIHFRGHVNRVLRHLTFAGGDPGTLPGRTLSLDGSSVGNVTSAVASPRLGLVGLGMVRVEAPEGAELEVDGAGKATVGPLPEGTKLKSS